MGADKLYVNGYIYTVNDGNEWAEAVAVEGNRITFVGNEAEGRELCDSDTEIIDLDGKMMLPGLIDGHCHPVYAAFLNSGVYLEIEWTIEECLSTVKAYIDENSGKDSYIGLGYSECAFDEKGPKRQMLDEICADKPIMLLSSSGHEAWVNTKALEMAGIDSSTPDPIPGFHYFQRDENGYPTGHLVELGPQTMVADKIQFFDRETVAAELISVSEDYASYGITTTCDMGLPAHLRYQYFDLIAEIAGKEIYKQRFFSCGLLLADLNETDLVKETLVKGRKMFNSDKCRFNFLKILNDGTLETRSAALSEPYNEDGSMVYPLCKPEELAELGIWAASNGFDINVHAIGNEAISGTLAMAKAVRESGYDDCRITNSHCDYVKDNELELFGRYNVIANTTCVWHYSNEVLEPIIGDRRKYTFRMKSILDGGARMGQGSDYPVDEFGREPLKGMEMGCTRKLFGDPEAGVLEPENERLSLEDVIRSYTINNAYQAHIDHKLGSIEEGKLADLTILEKNIFDVPLDEIHTIKVDETIVDGKTVFNRNV